MKLCNNYEKCYNIVGDYIELCRSCKPKKPRVLKGRPKKAEPRTYYKKYILSYKERYGLVKDEMPKQVTLKRDEKGNPIYD